MIHAGMLHRATMLLCSIDLIGKRWIFSLRVKVRVAENFSRPKMFRTHATGTTTEEGCMTIANHLRLVAIVAAFSFVAAVLIGMI